MGTRARQAPPRAGPPPGASQSSTPPAVGGARPLLPFLPRPLPSPTPTQSQTRVPRAHRRGRSRRGAPGLGQRAGGASEGGVAGTRVTGRVTAAVCETCRGRLEGVQRLPVGCKLLRLRELLASFYPVPGVLRVSGFSEPLAPLQPPQLPHPSQAHGPEEKTGGARPQRPDLHPSVLAVSLEPGTFQNPPGHPVNSE